MISSINNALGGMQAAQQSFLQSAQRISRLGTDQGSTSADPHGEMVDLMTSRRGYEANMQVVRASDEMLGTLLDTFA